MYIQVDEDFQDHPKAQRLCRLLRDRQAWAYCIGLWRVCTKYYRDGDLTGVSAGDLEFALCWDGDDGALYSALVVAGFIDSDDAGVRVHDWDQYQGAAIERMTVERERKRKWRETGAVPARRISDESTEHGVSTRNVDSVRGTSAGRPRDVRGTSGFVPGTSVVSIAEHSKAEETDSSVTLPRSEPATPQLALLPSPTEPPDPPLLTFPCAGPVPSWNLTASWVALAQSGYPQLDVIAECRKALLWLAGNKKKTARGMPTFLAGWMGRAQDRATPSAPTQQRRPVTASYRPLVAPPTEPSLTRAELAAIKAEVYQDGPRAHPDAPGSTIPPVRLSGDTQGLPLLKTHPRRST